MSIKKTIGGDRLGAGKKMTVDMRTYNRSTHDLGYIWRSTMSAGTLVPFLKEVALPGDTFDIDLEADVKTHPTIGPLFGSYKVQLDVFQAPIRLYQSALHNNAIGIGMNMELIKLPQLMVPLEDTDLDKKTLTAEQIEQLQNDPSSLLAHLDIVGSTIETTDAPSTGERPFNALPYLAYWDIYKNYYANKQEEIGMFINATGAANKITDFYVDDPMRTYITDNPEADANVDVTNIEAANITFAYPITGDYELNNLFVRCKNNSAEEFWQNIKTVFETITINGVGLSCTNPRQPAPGVTVYIKYYEYRGTAIDSYALNISEFPLENIDKMREDILAKGKYEQYLVTYLSQAPFGSNLRTLTVNSKPTPVSHFSQQGLALKTYQSDMFNNWMSTEWIDNASTGINAITAVSTAGDSFTIDALTFARKVYDMLNRIAISGGTYDDWVETVYTHEYINRTETPIYHGGLSRELVFQEVVSTAQSGPGEENPQPLGTLAGKGVMGQRKKGGKVTIKVDEPSYIIGIISLTPRIDYSQGNKWDVNLKTMDDFHKPALDEIGFQDLITEQMAWWTTDINNDSSLTFKSAGKQPAWMNYMTNVNKVRGNFAKANDQMFMTLNRRYEIEPIATGGGDDDVTFTIADLTTYVDPSKFNFIFADTDISSQNFWVQIGLDITARRKMSAKIMPNL